MLEIVVASWNVHCLSIACTFWAEAFVRALGPLMYLYVRSVGPQEILSKVSFLFFVNPVISLIFAQKSLVCGFFSALVVITVRYVLPKD